MKKTTVFDVPTRIFHWLFAFLFLIAFAIANTVDDESAFFSYHVFAGLTLGFLLLLRIIWGIAGTKFARFSSFKLKPGELIQYFKDSITSKIKKYYGHNPASSYASILIFICIIGLVSSGLWMTGAGENDLLEEVHELFANLFLITVIAHLLGLFIHHLSHKDSLWLSMVTGKKDSLDGEKGIVKTKPVAGIFIIILSLFWISYLNVNFNSQNRTLNFFGTKLTLGEEEHESNSGHEDEREHDEHEEDDDD